MQDTIPESIKPLPRIDLESLLVAKDGTISWGCNGFRPAPVMEGGDVRLLLPLLRTIPFCDSLFVVVRHRIGDNSKLSLNLETRW